MFTTFTLAEIKWFVVRVADRAAFVHFGRLRRVGWLQHRLQTSSNHRQASFTVGQPLTCRQLAPKSLLSENTYRFKYYQSNPDFLGADLLPVYFYKVSFSTKKTKTENFIKIYVNTDEYASVLEQNTFCSYAGCYGRRCQSATTERDVVWIARKGKLFLTLLIFLKPAINYCRFHVDILAFIRKRWLHKTRFYNKNYSMFFFFFWGISPKLPLTV